MSDLSPCVFVLFGATGDLTRRKLAPALYALHREKLLPEKFAVLAYARRDKDDAVFREDVKAAIEEFAPKLPTSGPEWEAFADLLHYQKGEFDEAGGYKALAERLTEIDADKGTVQRRAKAMPRGRGLGPGSRLRDLLLQPAHGLGFARQPDLGVVIEGGVLRVRAKQIAIRNLTRFGLGHLHIE